MTVAELEVRMSYREYIEQYAYDRLTIEARQEHALDAKIETALARG